MFYRILFWFHANAIIYIEEVQKHVHSIIAHKQDVTERLIIRL